MFNEYHAEHKLLGGGGLARESGFVILRYSQHVLLLLLLWRPSVLLPTLMRCGMCTMSSTLCSQQQQADTTARSTAGSGACEWQLDITRDSDLSKQ